MTLRLAALAVADIARRVRRGRRLGARGPRRAHLPVLRAVVRLRPRADRRRGGRDRQPGGRSTGSTASGGLSLGASLAFHPHSVVGLEVRLDTADVDVSTGGVTLPRARARAAVRDASPATSRSPRARATSSGCGRSRSTFACDRRARSASPPPAASATCPLPVRDPPADRGRARRRRRPQFEVAEIVLPAEALPEQEGDGRWGVNGGVGLQ